MTWMPWQKKRQCLPRAYGRHALWLRKLVGFVLPADSPKPLEGHLVLNGADISGNVTSCEYSQTLDQIIGLAYCAFSQSTPGSTLPIRVEGGREVQATVVSLPFFDPQTQRQEL